ncbi:MAG TPA: hypothetical protein VJH65_01200 [Candidatus Nanoarchaeia archaeon]|nr:hypothetical protein [Candidatus Nanoarchaeia archaeon]
MAVKNVRFKNILEGCSLFGLLDVQGFIHGLKAVVFSRILGIITYEKVLD